MSSKLAARGLGMFPGASPLSCAEEEDDGSGASLQIPAARGGPRGDRPEEAPSSQASCLRHAHAPPPGGARPAGPPASQQHRPLPPSLEKKKEDATSLGGPHGVWDPEREKPPQDGETGAPASGVRPGHCPPGLPGPRGRASRAPQEVAGTEDEGQAVRLSTEGPGTAEGAREREAEWGRDQGLPVSSPKGASEGSVSRGRQENRGPGIPGEPSVLGGLGTKEGSTAEEPQEQTGGAGVARQEEQAEAASQDVVKTLRHRLQKSKEQALHQEQLLKERERELKALQEQLSRGQEERASLQAALEQRQQEAARRAALSEEELAEQRDLIRAMKRRVLELIQEKDSLWQKVQQLSSMAPGCCVSCSKLFGRLSRRYPCRLCGGLVCHACSPEYKKQERRCPACAQKGEAQAV